MRQVVRTLGDLEGCSDPRQQKQLSETARHYAQIIQMLGSSWNVELKGQSEPNLPSVDITEAVRDLESSAGEDPGEQESGEQF